MNRLLPWPDRSYVDSAYQVATRLEGRRAGKPERVFSEADAVQTAPQEQARTSLLSRLTDFILRVYDFRSGVQDIDLKAVGRLVDLYA